MNTALILAFWIAVLRVLDPAHPREIPRIRNFSFPEFLKSQLRVLGAGLVFLGLARIVEVGLPGWRAMEAFLWILMPLSWLLVMRRDLSLSEWIIALGISLCFIPVFPAAGWRGTGSGVAGVVFLAIFFEIGFRALLDRLVYSPRGKSRAVWGIAIFSLGLLILALEYAALPFAELRWLDADPWLLRLFTSNG